MKIIKILILLLLVFFVLFACKQTVERNIPIDLEKNNSELKIKNIQNLKLHFTMDSVAVKNKTHYFSSNMKLKIHNNVIFILDNFLLTISDEFFQNVEFIDLSMFDYYFEGKVQDFSVYGNKIYFLDNSFKIKEYDFKSNKMNEIDISHIRNRNNIAGFVKFDIEKLNDTTMVVSNRLFSFYREFGYKEWELGYSFNNNGELKAVFNLPISRIDSTTWYNIPVEYTYINSLGNEVVFSFMGSKNIYIFDDKGNLKTQSSLIINETYWKTPRLKPIETSNLGESKLLTQSAVGVILKINELQMIGSNVFYLKFNTPEPVELILCDKNYEQIDNKVLENLDNEYLYELHVTKSSLILLNPPQMFVFREENEY